MEGVESEQWADYVVTAVRYTDDGTRIDRMQRWEDAGDRLADAQPVSRSSAKMMLALGRSYVTASDGPNGWQRGQEIGLVTVDGEQYLRTDGRTVPADDLGDLPEL